MAPLPDSTMRVANAATTTEIAPPRNANSVQDKVINADIRIRSIEDELQRTGQSSQAQETLVESTPNKDNGEPSAETQKNWWAEAIAENMDLADGYTKVAVLLIKWEDGLDELMTGGEVCQGETRCVQIITNKFQGQRTRNPLSRSLLLSNQDGRIERTGEATASAQQTYQPIHLRA